MSDYQNWIGGEHVAPSGGAYMDVRNPADTTILLGRAPASTPEDASQALAAARAALGNWAGMPAPERGRVMHRAANMLEQDADEWAAALSSEEGKTRLEARGEVIRAVELLRYNAGEAWRVGGDLLPSDTPHTLLYSIKVPVGVCSIITPWNFPLSVPVWKIAPALVTGNTVVWKPAEATPLIALRFGELMHQAGLPPGVFNIVCGVGRELGDILTTDERIDAVSFTGSYATGHGVYQKTARRMTRTHLELGGKNPLIVAADADVEKAVMIAARGGFGVTGQACTATSRVIVERPLLDAFSKGLAEVARNWNVGPGLADGVQMGPAISAEQRTKDLMYIEIAQDEGARLLAGGSAPDGGAFANGYFVQPTVLIDVEPDTRIAQEEVFGPVISVLAADTLDDAFRIANDVEYGLSASIVTNDIRKAMRYVEQAEAGMVKVNQITSSASLQAPFGGFKHSGSGMFREMGKGAVDFYTKVKTVWIDGQ